MVKRPSSIINITILVLVLNEHQYIGVLDISLNSYMHFGAILYQSFCFHLLGPYSLIPNKGIGWNNSIGRQNFQKLIIGEGGTISNKRVGWQKFRKLINRESLIRPA